MGLWIDINSTENANNFRTDQRRNLTFVLRICQSQDIFHALRHGVTGLSAIRQAFTILVIPSIGDPQQAVIEVASKCIGSIDYWESLTNRIHGSFSSRSTMRVLVDP